MHRTPDAVPQPPCGDPISREDGVVQGSPSRPTVAHPGTLPPERSVGHLGCTDCDATATVVAFTGREVRCPCGRIFTPRWPEAVEGAAETPPAPTPAAWERPEVVDVGAARAAWDGVARDLALARRFVQHEGRRAAGGPGEPRSTLGRLQGQAGGASRDASEHQVRTLWHVVQREGARARADFLATMERWLEETTPAVDDEDEVDWSHARRCAERLHALSARGEAQLLVSLAAELPPGASWREAALRAADVCAPPALRAAWSQRAAEERGIVGRPRRDAARPPIDVERAAWGEVRLAAAVALWTEAGRC